MRHKTITLCPTTYEIAKKNPNFSLWVRQELLKTVAIQDKGTSEYAYECMKCDNVVSVAVNRDYHVCSTCGAVMLNAGLANRWSGREE